MTATDEQQEVRSAPVQPRLGLVGSLRFVWRQLTSMRTALFLLLLLAVAAVPGSVLPQRGIDASKVTAYLAAHPTSGPWIDKVGGFEVYASVWFSAIYLLLFVSLCGCVLPRTLVHLKALRARPPRIPARLERLPAHRTLEVPGSPEDVLELARKALRRRRFRVEVRDGSISAERGYLRETGNLVFHLSLVVLLVAVALGHLLGWRGDVVVPVGTSFSDSVSAFDTIDPGPWVNTENLPPFSVDVKSMKVEFERQATQRGAPRDFEATVSSRSSPDAAPRQSTIRVNHPLVLDGTKVFLLGNGYAPVITMKDSTGQVVYSDATPFLPQDGNYTSTGVIKAPGAQPQQLGLIGQFLPTMATVAGMPRSIFPDALDPAILLTVLEGDLGLGSGAPQSVYTLNVDKMKPLKTASGDTFRTLLRPGQTIQLPNGKGSVTFERVERFAGLSIRHDPGKGWVLGAAIAAMLGLALSLFVPRRRVFVRVRRVEGDGDRDDGSDGGSDGGSGGGSDDGSGGGADGGGTAGRTLVEVGALARGEDTGLDDELQRLLDQLDPAGTPPTRRDA
ncbi:cytochrome c biogenesis protein ResB [Angustibacter sp. McL0619]|uniref:cytochrome c biogenesis protein ResB n=1 Tax=Angustibacter sp. McL0619 TaxID=3415676 RepID=UPI003CEC3518